MSNYGILNLDLIFLVCKFFSPSVNILMKCSLINKYWNNSMKSTKQSDTCKFYYNFQLDKIYQLCSKNNSNIYSIFNSELFKNKVSYLEVFINKSISPDINDNNHDGAYFNDNFDSDQFLSPCNNLILFRLYDIANSSRLSLKNISFIMPNLLYLDLSEYASRLLDDDINEICKLKQLIQLNALFNMINSHAHKRTLYEKHFHLIFNNLTNLRTLCISREYRFHYYLESLSVPLKSKLEYLTLFNSIASIELLILYHLHFTALKQLRVCGWIKFEELEEFNLPRAFPQLRDLTLGLEYFTDELAIQFSQFKYLMRLRLSIIRTEEQHIIKLFSLPNIKTSLRILEFNEMDCTKSIFEAISELPNLKHLGFGLGWGVGKYQLLVPLVEICQILMFSKSIQSCFHWNRYDFEAKPFSNNTQLQTWIHNKLRIFEHEKKPDLRLWLGENSFTNDERATIKELNRMGNPLDGLVR